MSILSENMRYMRSQLKNSQQKVADTLLITRGRYAKYEEGSSEPPLELLAKISRYFHVSIDLLISVDLRKFPLKDIIAMPDNRIVLPVQMDQYGREAIEIIPHKAQMGYLLGYSDPEYIEQLQQIQLPFLTNGKYRAFPTQGDSMPPHKDGTLIVGKYIEQISDLKINKTYIFITRNDGILYKRLGNKAAKQLTLISDNPLYSPITLMLTDIIEIWAFACSISMEEHEPYVTTTNDEVREMFYHLHGELKHIHQQIKKFKKV